MPGPAAAAPEPTEAETVISGVDAVIRSKLNEELAGIEARLGADGMAFVGPVVFGIESRVRIALEQIKDRRAKLAVIVDTPGGVVEVVERIVDTLRHHYREVVFVIPDRAMSAGTVLALSGDAILMDYFSVLGPIDPQIEKDKRLIPALSYLAQFEQLIARSQQGQLTTAEMVLLQKLDLGELQQFKEARELSISLLKTWLVRYKFKDWTRTEGRGLEVTREYKENRAEEIAKVLSDPQEWHSHGRGISMETLRGDKLKLKIDDFGADARLARAVRSYFGTLTEYLATRGLTNFVHTRAYF
jgi:hypothetical protein